MKKILGLAAVLSVSATALAIPTPLIEIEANDTPATANFVAEAFYPFGGVAIDGFIAPGDIDWFSFDLRAGDLVTGAIYDFDPLNNFGGDWGGVFDSFLVVVDPFGAVVHADDDDNTGFLSSLYFRTSVAGRWKFGVTGFGDGGDGAFDGRGHQETSPYKFVFGINPIPEPASLGLILAGLALGFRRR